MSDTSVRVSWDNDGFGDSIEFVVFYTLVGSKKRQNERMIVVSHTDSSVVISDLITGRQYLFEVVARVIENGQSVLGPRPSVDPVVVTTPSSSICKL